ncbi:hypothetical protein NEFER03_1680 [Nematocida sp. LUAm3]|nr:hypothetical protein NEFER03_1680 [Nematocida sp. LUAm3]KAI5175670.1 hypothetical protein NEFER02_1557 [Nematocida sp. LUAm2]KAI5178576.1 hypothetical protein NEFER01_1712 [Nematocida sp. LUAm1]
MTSHLREQLEYMADEILYYEENRIFSKKEIESIIKKRGEHESLIHSSSALHAFLKYIEYEVLLDRIYHKRVHGKEDKEYIRERIDRLFIKARKRFSSNIEVALSHIQYFLHVSEKERVVELAVELPKRYAGCSKAWIYSANALRQVGEIDSSRTILQRALRILKNKEEVLYAFMELESLYPQDKSESIIDLLEKEMIKIKEKTS